MAVLIENGEQIQSNNTSSSKNELRSSSVSMTSSSKEEEFVLNGSKLADYIEINEDDLTFYESCGRGSYGSVYRGLWKSRNKIVAIKKLLQLDNNEAEILSSCSHRNIIQFYGIVSKAQYTLSYGIITEYAEYGSLHSFIGLHDLYNEYGLELILKWAHDIALGMNYLHSEAPIKIIHRDLKSNNVLITHNKHDDEYTCKICDFGSSKWGIQTTKMTIAGTFPWMSQEIIQSKPANQSCDTWSYGVVLWELITGKVPFKGIEEFQIAFLIVEREQRLPIPSGCPKVLANLMQMCWQTDPKGRPTFKSILNTLDQIDIDDDAKAEIDSLIYKNKSKWELEIELAFERLKKIEDDLHIKEKLLEAREKRLRELEIEYITASSKLITVEDHDINSWTKNDVCEWLKKIAKNKLRISLDETNHYCEKFLNHDINGKRLLLMTKADLRNIGILFEGHILEIFHDIQALKLENTRLLNFPPLRNFLDSNGF
jgi:sterile alpha motif and leucine zipper-containing kinase AZK